MARRRYLRVRDLLLRNLLKRSLTVKEIPGGLRMVGTDYGGWLVPSEMVRPNWICYDGGVGEDLSFAQGLIAQYGCHVFAFDPTPRAIAYAAAVAMDSELFTFLPVGLWSSSVRMPFYSPRDPRHVSHSITDLQRTSEVAFDAECRSLPDLMRELGHVNIDLLKLDIEGAEFEVLASLLNTSTRPTLICVEFDQPSSIRKVLRTIRRVTATGYELIAIDRWNFTFLRSHQSSLAVKRHQQKVTHLDA